MVSERLQAPNEWPLFTSLQKRGKSLPRKQFLKIQFIPFAFVCYPLPAPPVTAESTRLASCPSVAHQAEDLMQEARHLPPKRQITQGSQHRCCQITSGPRRTSSLDASCSRAPTGHAEEHPALAPWDGQLCDCQAEEGISTCDMQCWPAPI